MADAEPDRIPLLQIVHVSDLHVGDDYDDKQGIAAEERAFRRVARQMLEDKDIGGWREGTLTSDTTAIPALDKFLDDLRKSDTEWFSEPGKGAQTWLLDTGDLTTFGDAGSLSLALQRLEGWRKRLEPCTARILYGNHDAWPGTQPIIKAGNDWDELMRRQHDILDNAGFDPAQWLNPLVVENKAADARVELYGLDSVLFDWDPNSRALGAIDDGMINELLKRIRSRKDNKRTYRILAVHHPVAYPYLASETKSLGFSKSVMTNAKRVAEMLGKRDSAYGKIPIHLFLSGHTHGTHPAGQLPHNVKELRQGPMSQGQLQLVIGPLMLIRDVLGSTDAAPRKVRRYSDSTIRDTTRQLQVLRFHIDKAYENGLVLERFIAAYEPGFRSHLGTARTYVPLAETISETVVLF